MFVNSNFVKSIEVLTLNTFSGKLQANNKENGANPEGRSPSENMLGRILNILNSTNN